ncbi:hypothetical protein CHU00_11260 [Sphingobacterium cellulitidis]|uniref:Uncharacterized protein n=1 Tax=Sphingobacterium cellulitidis TaxID=1768011 RepID=A0A8H9FXI0_9SPHI|nr:asparagine N-glycosylation enzyme membrane subunit Stt3 [Sphingobacterium soli]OYD45537.1 hypothetical protein CHU00_11260 [Sphingobacterium cellulitidis]GGE11400.1 hypothetical protein GCM10011516_06460 [Sphingobacterium soli]
MNKLFHQTKQAFLFSLTFYILSICLFLLKIGFAPILLSISALLSLIWVVLVLLEVMKSVRISNGERLMIVLFIILGNILAGIVYFYFLREKVTGYKEIKKK